jgi:hypothetical protein
MPTDTPANHPTRRALVAVATAAALLAGLGFGGERLRAEGQTGPVPGAAGAELRSAVPGLYIPDVVVAHVEPSGTVTLRTPRPCAELTEILLAGDWHRTQQLDVPAEYASILAIGGLRPMTLLRQGDAHALLSSNDRPDGCRAAVTVAPDGQTSIDAGVAAIDQAGWAHTTTCIRSGSSVSLSVVAGGDGMSAVLQLVIEGDGPERTASVDSSTDSMVVIGDVGVLDVFSSTLAAGLGGISAPPAGMLTVDGEGSSGRASVDDADGGLRGTLEFSGARWYDEHDGRSGVLGAAVPFACPGVTTLS